MDREHALLLRRHGLLYREIGELLGCSASAVGIVIRAEAPELAGGDRWRSLERQPGDPTPEEIKDRIKEIREDGWTDARGQFQPPWDERTERRRRVIKRLPAGFQVVAEAIFGLYTHDKKDDYPCDIS